MITRFCTARCAAFLLLSLGLSAWTASAQEWTRFRGPNGTGIGKGDLIPTKWSTAEYNWRVKLPGVGNSSPVIWGDRVFVLSADPESATRYAQCLNAADGSTRWQRDFHSQTHHLHTRNTYATSTPAVDDERVYFAWSTPAETTLKAFDHDGKEVWSRDLGQWKSDHGFATSPILLDDLLILHNSQLGTKLEPGEKPGDSSMVALRRQTGEEVWRTPLTSDEVCYSVPFLYQPQQGKPELICTSTGNGLFSLDPHTGKENWSLNDGLFEMRTVASPMEAGGLIFGSTGTGAYSMNYLVAVRPGMNPQLVYKLSNSGKFKSPYVPCYIAKDNLLFLIYDRGFASCIDAPSGAIRWFERVNNQQTGAPANFSGSPVRVDERIFIIDEDGVVFVFAAQEKFEVLAQNPLGEESRSTPAISGGRMYLRTLSHLVSIGGKTS